MERVLLRKWDLEIRSEEEEVKAFKSMFYRRMLKISWIGGVSTDEVPRRMGESPYLLKQMGLYSSLKW